MLSEKLENIKLILVTGVNQAKTESVAHKIAQEKMAWLYIRPESRYHPWEHKKIIAPYLEQANQKPIVLVTLSNFTLQFISNLLAEKRCPLKYSEIKIVLLRDYLEFQKDDLIFSGFHASGRLEDNWMTGFLG